MPLTLLSLFVNSVINSQGASGLESFTKMISKSSVIDSRVLTNLVYNSSRQDLHPYTGETTEIDIGQLILYIHIKLSGLVISESFTSCSNFALLTGVETSTSTPSAFIF